MLDQRYKRWRWITFVVTWLIYAGFHLTRQSYIVARIAFSDDDRLAITREDFGRIDTYYLTTYMIGQFFFGALGDRYGPRPVLLFGISLSVLSLVAWGFATGLSLMILLAVAQGIAQSTGWSNTSKVMCSWFSLRERGRVFGWWCTNFAIGAAVALPFTGYLMESFGRVRLIGEVGPSIVPYWPASFWGSAAVFTFVFAIAWFYLRSQPEDLGLPSIESYHNEAENVIHQGDSPENKSAFSWGLIAEVLRSPFIWLLSFAYFFIKLTRYAFTFWGPKYIHESLDSDVQASTIIAASLPVGGAIGIIISGYISDNFFQNRRAPAAILFILLTAITLLVGPNAVSGYWTMASFFFLIGLFSYGPDSLVSGTAAIDFGTKKGAGTATGLVNGIGSIGAILGGWLPSVLTTEKDWSSLFLVLLVGTIMSAAILIPMWYVKPPAAEQKD